MLNGAANLLVPRQRDRVARFYAPTIRPCLVPVVNKLIGNCYIRLLTMLAFLPF